MKTAALLVLLFLLQPTAQAQTGKKILYLVGASVVAGTVDWAGFNLARNSPTKLRLYRVGQWMMHGALFWIIKEQVGLPTAIGFVVVGWTFNFDLVYYLVDGTIGDGDFRDVLNDEVRHAGYTPVGWFRGWTNEKIAGNTLFAQAGAGLAFAITLSIAL